MHIGIIERHMPQSSIKKGVGQTHGNKWLDLLGLAFHPGWAFNDTTLPYHCYIQQFVRIKCFRLLQCKLRAGQWCASHTGMHRIGQNHQNQTRIGPKGMANTLTHPDERSPDRSPLFAALPTPYSTIICHGHFTVPIPFCTLLQYLRWFLLVYISCNYIPEQQRKYSPLFLSVSVSESSV